MIIDFKNSPKIAGLYTEVLKQINCVLVNTYYLQEIDKRYSKGINGNFTLMILIVVAVLNVLGFKIEFVTLIIAAYYPAMRSIRTIKSSSIVEYHRWATYWLIFTSTAIVFNTWIQLILGYLPYFQLWKIGFYISLFHPKSDLAYKFYLLILNPTLKRFLKKKQPKQPKQTSKKQQPQRYSFNNQKSVLQITPTRKYSDVSIKST